MLFRLFPVPLCVMKVVMHVNGVQSQNPQSTPQRWGLESHDLTRVRLRANLATH